MLLAGNGSFHFPEPDTRADRPVWGESVGASSEQPQIEHSGPGRCQTAANVSEGAGRASGSLLGRQGATSRGWTSEMRRPLRTNRMDRPSLESPGLLTADEVAAYLRVRRKTVYEYVERGDLACRRLGPRLIRFTWADVHEFVGEAARVEHPDWDPGSIMLRGA